MKLLIDTHILLWALLDDDRLPQKARELLTHTESDVYHSIISLWAIELKHLLHPTQMPINAQAIDAYAQNAGFQSFPLHDRHIFALSSSRSAHRSIYVLMRSFMQAPRTDR